MQEGDIDKTSIETALNLIYSPYGTKWQLTIDQVFTNRTWDEEKKA